MDDRETPSVRQARARRIARRVGRSGLPGALLLSALLVVFSEVFYWYAGGTDYPVRVLFYLLPTTALLWTMWRFPATGWPAVVLAGAVYGVVTEGVLTAVLYGAFPFDPFALSYTSLAWHSMVAVGFGLVLLHRLLVARSPVPALVLISAFGVLWGAWARALSLPAGPDDPSEGVAALRGDVPIAWFATYTVAATVAVGLGHGLLGRVVHARHLAPGPALTRTVLVLAGLLLAVLVVPAAPWALVVLPVLLGVCAVALSRVAGRGAEPSDRSLVDQLTRPVPTRHLIRLVALPVAATATYAGLVLARVGDDTVRDLCLDLVVGAQTVAGWALFLAALAAAWRSRPVSRSEPGRFAGRPTPSGHPSPRTARGRRPPG